MYLEEMKSFFKGMIFCFIVFGVGSILSESEDLTRIKLIQEAVTKGNRYKVYAVDLFDGDNPWKIVRGTSYLEETSFVTKSPNSEEYAIESKLYYPLKTPEKLKSLQVHSNVEIPGRDKYQIQPEIQKAFPIGNPSRLFLWVYSNNYDINLKVILSKKRAKDIVIDFGLLKFNGWRRLDTKVGLLKEERLNLTNKSVYSVKGILLETSTLQSKGSFYLYIDQMGVLLETPNLYPGSEVPDGWELY